MTLRLRHLTLCLSLTTLMMLPGCLEDRCEIKSAQVELTVTFSGVSGAQRLEFETWVEAPGNDTQRVGSMAFPSLNDGKATFLLDPGQYVHNLPEGVTAYFQVMLRVYGEKEGVDDALLAEGRWERTISPTGCYIDAAMTVTSQGTCANKIEGDPCVAPAGNAHAVCKPDGAEGIDCEPSTCGDGFTDRRNGEICDPGHSAPVADCDDNCLPLPVVLRVNPEITTDEARLSPGVKIGVSHATTLDGFYAVDTPDGATDLAANILIADLDGDSQDELALGLPGAPAPNTSGIDADKTGGVYLMDWPILADPSLGATNDGMYHFSGPDSLQGFQGSWFGASLAAGDVDGNGTLDLAIGAPRMTGTGSNSSQRGGLYVVFSGEGVGYITAEPRDGLVMNDANNDSFQSFYGYQGAQGNQAGDHLGYAVVMADFNLDGYADIAVSAPHRKEPAIDSHGTVYVLRGGDDFWGSGANDQIGISGIANLEIFSMTVKSRLGVSLAAGDLNGDGYPDLIAGMTTGFFDEEETQVFEGGVTVLFGSEDALPPGGRGRLQAHPGTTEGQLLTLAPDSNHVLAGLGGTVTVVDLDGDGRAELVATLGRPGISAGDPNSVVIINGDFFAREQHSTTALPGVGDFTVIHGPGGPDTPANSRFGLVLTATDVSGDRRPDLLVSAPWADDGDNAIDNDRAGAVFAFLASPRSNLWDRENLSTDELLSWDSVSDGNIPVGLILLQGIELDGQLGAATAGSTHLAQSNSHRDCREAYTYIMQPGWGPNANSSYGGRIHTYFLPATLPCESQNLCQRLCQ